MSGHFGRRGFIHIPIRVTTLVTCSNSMPENPVELIVKPEKPRDVRANHNNVGREHTTNA